MKDNICIFCYGDHKHGLSYKEIEILFKKIYDNKSKSKMKKFNKWITGQTAAVEEATGELLYYRYDIDRFIRNLPCVD